VPGQAANRSLVIVTIAVLLAAGTWALVRFTPGTGDSVGLRTGYAGHVTLINIWATWCVPCKAEMPSLERLYEAYHDRGFRVAATSIDKDGPAPILAFAHDLGLSFDILHDRSGNIQQAYQTVGVPESFLIDKRGRITYVALGAEAWDSPANRQRIEHLLAAGD
jgi:cytochrome c-type biogenesis protein